MAFKQTLSITMTDCCDTIQLCDTTCYPNPCNAVSCTDGYGVSGNVNKWEVAETAFSIKFPDGNMVTTLDFGYKPNNKSYASVTITGGNSGTVQVSLPGYGVLGVTSYLTSLSVTTANLVAVINSLTSSSGWSALVDGTTSTKFWIFNENGDGSGANGAPVNLTVTGTMTMTSDATTTGGTDDPDCLSLTLAQIWAENNNTVLNNNPGPAFADGVYEFTYHIYDAGKVTELGRVSQTVFFDCNAVNCLKEALLTGDNCGCDDNYDERILKTRLKIEQARHQFNECLFSCAQESILKAGKMCSDVCKDC